MRPISLPSNGMNICSLIISFSRMCTDPGTEMSSPCVRMVNVMSPTMFLV